MQKTILIISFSDLARDPRVNRHIRFLREQYHVVAAGFGDSKIPGVQHIVGTPPSKRELLYRGVQLLLFLSHQYDQLYWFPGFKNQFYDPLSTTQADVILANDIDALPLAIRLAKLNKAKVIFDAHEYAPREFEDRLYWKIFHQPYRTYLCHQYIPQVDAMMTVCQGIAEQYEKDTGIKPLVVTNATSYVDIQPSMQPQTEQRIRMIHHGAAMRSRKIENMMDIMNYLDERFSLDLLLISDDPRYLAELKKKALSNPRIRFLEPVPMQELVAFAHQYDVGLFLLEPTNFNYLHALPNKFFEFIQSRLVIAIGPSPEMARIVQSYDCGIVSEDFTPQSLAKRLMQLDHSKITYYKQQAHNVAQVMSSEQNRVLLLDLVERTLGGDQV